MTFCVIGGGPTGVELSGIIGELAQKSLPREFRNMDTRKSRVMLVEAGAPGVAGILAETLAVCHWGAETARCRGSLRRSGHRV